MLHFLKASSGVFRGVWYIKYVCNATKNILYVSLLFWSANSETHILFLLSYNETVPSSQYDGVWRVDIFVKVSAYPIFFDVN